MASKAKGKRVVKLEYQLVIDPTVCDGYGYCVELLPANLIFDDWGYPIIKDRCIDEEHLELAYRAVKLCPKLAFRLNKIRNE